MEGARRARPEDLADIVDLAREASAELRPIRGGAIWFVREARPEPVGHDLEAAVAGDQGRIALVGLYAGATVGYATMQLETLHDGTTLAVVDDIYVTPEARGVAVGEAMMDLLIAEAERAGAMGIDALALPGDRATKNFFERFGLTARAILVHRPLSPARESDSGETSSGETNSGGTER